MRGRVLIIAGSDPSGGAGIQADIKTVTALGGYAMTAITALTVQNTKGVFDVMAVPTTFVEAQLKAIFDDIGADVIKIGMIGDRETAITIATFLRSNAKDIPVVLDPVLTATSGDALAGEGVAGVILDELMPLASIATPNTEELAALTGSATVMNVEAMIAAGEKLMSKTQVKALVLKGGHMPSDAIVDVLLTDQGTLRFEARRIPSTSTHGTGCTLASAIATRLAQGQSLPAAVEQAIAYVRKAIETAPGYGGGHGPLNHGHNIPPPNM